MDLAHLGHTSEEQAAVLYWLAEDVGILQMNGDDMGSHYIANLEIQGNCPKPVGVNNEGSSSRTPTETLKDDGVR
jgi:hypothetical protein